jgi:hypothetical protein
MRNDGGYTPANANIDGSMTGSVQFPGEDYAERWFPEKIEIFVDENGVQGFSWRNPIEIVETLNESAALLPFEDVKERIKQNIKNGFSWLGDNAIAEVNVDKVQLTSVLLPIKDDLEHQYIKTGRLRCSRKTDSRKPYQPKKRNKHPMRMQRLKRHQARSADCQRVLPAPPCRSHPLFPPMRMSNMIYSLA